MASITVDLRPGDRLVLGEAVVEFEHKSGRLARLRVSAPQQVPVQRLGLAKDGEDARPSPVPIMQGLTQRIR